MDHIVTLILTLTAAAGGAWFGAYLQEKGKNWATKEDVQALTRLTEQVRADVSGKLWLDQKRWDLKKDFYSELLIVLGEARVALKTAERLFGDLAKSRGDELRKAVNDLKITAGALSKNEADLGRVFGIGRIILPGGVVEVLEKFQARLQEINQEASKRSEHIAIPPGGVQSLPEKDQQKFNMQLESELPKIVSDVVGKSVEELRALVEKVIPLARKDLLSL